jgi:transcriptional regulator with XRE-family HTH domain
MQRKRHGHSNLADFIRDRRRELRLSQREFAVESGLSFDFIRRLEQGTKNLTLSRVEQALAYFGFTLTPTRRSETDD